MNSKYRYLKVTLKVQESKVLLKVALKVQVPVRRYDKSLRIQFQYERWKGRPACQSCHDSSEQIQKYRNTEIQIRKPANTNDFWRVCPLIQISNQ